MNLLRASVANSETWWEMRLLDLEITVDGPTEQEMLRELEYTLTAEYHLAKRFGQTPFVSLQRGAPTEQAQHWCDKDKNFRSLNLPEEVRQALAAVFRLPNLQPFRVESDAA